MENEDINQENINKEVTNDSEKDVNINVKNLVEKLESLTFEDRVIENPNKKRIKIEKTIADEMIAEIDYLNKPTKEGTLIKASDMNCIKELVLHSYNKSTDALKSATEALNISNGAPATFDPNEKAQCDASNISNNNVDLWRKKLQIMSFPIGMILPSAFIQNNEYLHLLDGAELNKNGPYASFYQWVINNIDNVPHYEDDVELISDYPSDSDSDKIPKTAIEKYQYDISTYGQCGRFVITDTYVKLPTITEFIASSNNKYEIGIVQLDQFKSHNHSMSSLYDDANYNTGTIPADDKMSIPFDSGNVRRTHHTNNEGGSETRPKNVRYPYYIVIANKSNEELTVNTECVKTTGNQVIGGIKTFEEGILVPDWEV